MPVRVLRHPKGYEIAVTSWENDYDNVKTEYYNTSNKEHAIAVVKFCKLFKKSEWEGGIANTYDPGSSTVDKIREVIVDFYKQYPIILLGNESEQDEELIFDWCIELASELGLSGTDFFTRKLEKLEIHYFNQDVYVDYYDEDDEF